jgi:alpha-galactosidase
MSFGLWVEPEMISPDSQLARQHSDWILGPRRGAGPTSRHQQVLDISNPDAWAFILDRISSLVDEYSIDFLKWDHNRDLLEAVRDVHGTRRPAVHDQTRALYALIDELHRRHPTLEIESCSAGGGRIDLEMMTRSQRVWLTDCNDPVERENIQQWSGLLLPPELIGTHVGAAESHTTHRHARLPFQLISSLFSHAGVERDLTTCDSDTLRTFQRWAALYKELRPVLHSGRTVHADLSDPALLLHGVVAEDKRHAVFAWVSLATPEGAHAGRVRFPGLNTELDYDLRIHTELGEPQYAEIAHPDWYSRAVTDGAEISGAILTQVGVPLPTLAPADALLIELIAVND